MELIVENVSHSYNGMAALSDINLHVGEGEVITVIGPSGCGKSTLLGIMGGLVRPGAGSVLTQGRAPEGCLNPITYVFQDFALLPWLSVAENVALVLGPHGLSKIETAHRVTEMLARTGLADFANSFPKQLSGGMRQRCGIARALAVRPAILLLDEPLSALDAQTRELLMEDFLDLWRSQSTTAVHVTHNLDEALALADRVVVLSRRPGKIKEIVPVAIPRDDRQSVVHAAELADLRHHLWNLIRSEAQVADRELNNV